MEQLAQVGGIAGIAALIGVVLAFIINYRKGNTDNFSAQMFGFQTQIQEMSSAFQTQMQEMRADFREHIQSVQLDNREQTAAFKAQINAMQTGFDSQLASWKSLWEASTLEIRELKMEIKELRNEIDKLRTENAELKGQLKEHYKLA